MHLSSRAPWSCHAGPNALPFQACQVVRKRLPSTLYAANESILCKMLPADYTSKPAAMTVLKTMRKRSPKPASASLLAHHTGDFSGGHFPALLDCTGKCRLVAGQEKDPGSML